MYPGPNVMEIPPKTLYHVGIYGLKIGDSTSSFMLGIFHGWKFPASHSFFCFGGGPGYGTPVTF